jgi:DNA adenine methylase
MSQLSFLSQNYGGRTVNVASVPQRSPFRYPGGKTWLIPWIRQWLISQDKKPQVIIEPFAGGGIVSLTAVFEGLADSAVMIELDEDVSSVWYTILNGRAQWLADRIVDFELTPENVRDILASDPISLEEKAFQTLLKNRVVHGGILAAGSGLIKHGENGKGLKSRWYPETLAKRIKSIALKSENIQFYRGDGIEFMRRHIKDADTVFFIDPPYTAGGKRAGTRLYTHNELDHTSLFDVTQEIMGEFLMTYDDAQRVRELADRHGFHVESIFMAGTHHAKTAELLIGRNLQWANPNTY